MSAAYSLSQGLLDRTFSHFRECGCGRQECQVLWISSWLSPVILTDAVHPKHESHLGSFVLDDRWLHEFWLRLGRENMGVRVQVHTHPGAAFHSRTDDEYPIIHKPGFLSLVIPRFALGPVGFENAFLTEIQADGTWKRTAISSRLTVAK